jgi:hypothetical protein
MTRKTASCINCGEEREIAAHGLCFACYRREERSVENPWAAPDKHNRAILKAHGQLRKAITAILNALDSAIDHIAEADVSTIRNICGGYLGAMATGLLTPKSEESEKPSVANSSPEPGREEKLGPTPDETPVNGEHESEVNRSHEPGAKTENSEQSSAVNSSPEPEREEKLGPIPNETPVNSEQKSQVNRSQVPGAAA